MKDNKKNNPSTINELIIHLKTSYHVFFDLMQPQKKYRKYFKFQILSETVFYINCKETKQGLRIDILENNYFKIRSTKESHVYDICALSSRELLEKIIKHNLI